MTHLLYLNLCCGCRVLDLNHSLIEQTQELQRKVLTLVKERIITTQPCTVTEDVQEGGTCTGMFGFNKTIKVRLLWSHILLFRWQSWVYHYPVTTFQGDVSGPASSPPNTNCPVCLLFLRRYQSMIKGSLLLSMTLMCLSTSPPKPPLLTVWLN